ncbi:MAG: phosphohydrolase, partial [Lachnospiraceae bacterium]|nr:phosphohydrolase [Lachnospiraceae bacterium]
KDKSTFDIHDRVNYAVTESKLKINVDKKVISLNLQIDESICTMYEYFDIFLGRMMMCRGAAELLGAKFKLTANGSKVL